MSEPATTPEPLEVSVRCDGEPLSQNRVYRIIVIPARNGRRPFASLKMTDEGKAFKERIHYQMLAARPRGWPPIEDAVVEVECVYRFGSLRPDVDGPGKLVIDSLQGALIKNDRQVSDFIQRRRLDREHPHFIVIVRLVGQPPPRQGAML